MYYDDVDRGLIQMLQGDIPLTSRPYEDLAAGLQVSEESLVQRLAQLKELGVIRRLGAILRHHKAGFSFNAMVVWKTNPEEAGQKGQALAQYTQVSHCYQRQVPPGFDYELFTMIHLRSEDELSPLLQEMSRQTGLSDFLVIKSVREFKKTSMKYI